MDARTLFQADNLATIPTDKQVVVYCYTGQTVSQVTSALRMLGYDAYNMTFGMQAWTTDTDVRAKMFNAETHSFGYAYQGTAAPAAEEATTEEATTATTQPETMPPVEGLLVGLGPLTAAAGVYLRRRKAA